MIKTNATISLDAVEDEECGFIEGEVNIGKPIATFSFTSEPAAAAPLTLGRMSFRTPQKGATPAVDGEEFTLVRSYKLRPSTVKKLNQLKAQHDDANVYLNTIVDEAISFYYEHGFSRKAKS